MMLEKPDAETLKQALAPVLTHADVLFEGSGRPFNYIHRVIKGKNIWYFANPGSEPVNHTVCLRTQLKHASLMDPRTGTAAKAELNDNTGSGISFFLKLNPGESVFLVE